MLDFEGKLATILLSASFFYPYRYGLVLASVYLSLLK